MIQKEPGIIIGFITKLLGFIFNFVFDIIHDNITVANSLGISIIVITIIVRILIWPLSIKQVKNSLAMQHIQPELKKLQKKYPDKSDIESQKKLNFEIQKLYAENNIHPAGGCLLAFIQLPIFMALNQLLARSYCYISDIGDIYRNLAEKIMSVPNYVGIMKPIAIPKVPPNMTIDLRIIEDMQKVINKFTSTDWANLLAGLDLSVRPEIANLLIRKESIENFFGIDLIDQCGLHFPGVMIPILSVITTFLSSYFMNKMMPIEDEGARTQQKIFLIIMPLMMGGFSLALSSGVGVYWITSSIIQLIQQFFANKYRKKLQEENNNAR